MSHLQFCVSSGLYVWMCSLYKLPSASFFFFGGGGGERVYSCCFSSKILYRPEGEGDKTLYLKM